MAASAAPDPAVHAPGGCGLRDTHGRGGIGRNGALGSRRDGRGEGRRPRGDDSAHTARGRTRNLRRRRRRDPRRYALRLSLGDLLGVRRGMSPTAPPPAWPTPANVRGRRAQRELYAVVDRLIARREAAGAQGDNLLSRLLSARDPDTGAAMDDQHICDEALIFLLAGHETTSIALTFALDLLARHPREQEQIHDKVDGVLDGRLRPPTVRSRWSAPRWRSGRRHACIRWRRAWAACRGRGRYRRLLCPERCNGGPEPLGQHRHPAFWENSEEFHPSHFDPEHEPARHRYAYFPVGAGPRACIGGAVRRHGGAGRPRGHHVPLPPFLARHVVDSTLQPPAGAGV
jgi:Cytochrome P450